MKVKDFYSERPEVWLEHNLSGLTDLDAEMIETERTSTYIKYSVPGGFIFVNNSACDTFETQLGEQYFLD